ncbi:hypothetical protein TRIP_B200385 [uncultured Desulfatiglans sp.]|nr:hypothetical protein TRIP_B200385 [uncultured Desulfatiglans sp.]
MYKPQPASQRQDFAPEECEEKISFSDWKPGRTEKLFIGKHHQTEPGVTSISENPLLHS